MVDPAKRQPKGHSNGGQFATGANPESDVELPTEIEERSHWPRPRQTELIWTPDVTNYPPPPQRERKPYPYLLTTPPMIAQADILLSGETSALVEDAARAIEQLNASVDASHYEMVASPLLRAEAISSSRIEGLRASHRSIAQARENPAAAKTVAREIANSVSAMEDAIQFAIDGPLTTDVIRKIHVTLARGTDLEAFGGEFRTKQNWIGPSNHGPFNAVYVPPKPDDVADLMNDLVEFASRTNIPAVAQAAIVHSQFEAVHPFADGNGRVGRTLIHVVLRRRGLSMKVVPPISTVLAARRDSYVESLAAYQERGDVNQWISHFARATFESAIRAEGLSSEIAGMVNEWGTRIGRRQTGSAVDRMIEVLVQHPIISAETAASNLGVTEIAARRILGRFTESKVIREITDGRRNRVWGADEVFDLLDAFEHGIAADGDGSAKAPSRHLRSK
jgi:Fic family protein